MRRRALVEVTMQANKWLRTTAVLSIGNTGTRKGRGKGTIGSKIMMPSKTSSRSNSRVIKIGEF